MKKIIIGIGLMGLLLSQKKTFGQIHFEQSKTWEQILQLAQKENKYIFVDCYATWCGPCKQMDKEAYLDTAIGKFFDQQFIAVKVQMDKTAGDDAVVKTWYEEAHKLETDAHIEAYPTLLFFSPNGELAHKAVGYFSTFDFLKQAIKATDRNYQEYTLLAHYRKGDLPDNKIPDLVSLLRGADEKKQGTDIAHAYIDSYLLKLPDELLLRPANLGFIAQYLDNTADPAFKFFYQNQGKIDSVIRKDFSDDIITTAIIAAEINPRLWSDVSRKRPITTNPDWQAIYTDIINKYNKHFADECIIDPKITWFKQHQLWTELVQEETLKIETTFFDLNGKLHDNAADALNNINYDYIVLHCNDPIVLKKALFWQGQVMKTGINEPDYIDTYASLLYKTGNKKEALKEEERALSLKQIELNKTIAMMKQTGSFNPEQLDDIKNHLQELQTTLKKIKNKSLTFKE